jgi:acetyltransferase-like isoleucine patch superfamily enzyme
MANQFLLRLRNKLRIERGNFVKIGKRTQLKGTFISITGKNNHLVIQDGVKIRNAHIEIIGENCLVEIGSNTIIGINSYISAKGKNTKLIIGKECAFSKYIKLMTSDGHDIFQAGKIINPARDIHIMDHVWLAIGVTVLKGVTVGEGSIVGLHSVLTKSVQDHVIAVGNPARVVKKQVTHNCGLKYMNY